MADGGASPAEEAGLIPRVTQVVDLSGLDRLLGRLERELAVAVEQAAGRTQEKAMMAAPVDTGALQASIFTHLYGRNGYSAAKAAAQARRPGGLFIEMPEPPSSPYEALIAAGMDYAYFVERGRMVGGTSGLGAGPPMFQGGALFMAGAREASRGILADEVRDALRRAAA